MNEDTLEALIQHASDEALESAPRKGSLDAAGGIRMWELVCW